MSIHNICLLRNKTNSNLDTPACFRSFHIFLHWEMLHGFFCHLLIFFKTNFLKNSFKNFFHFRVSYSLDPDQVGHFVGPGLGPNCLQRLLEDSTCWQIVRG